MFHWVSIQDEEQLPLVCDGKLDRPEHSDQDESANETAEAKESKLVELYTEAIQAQSVGHRELAKHRYKRVLEKLDEDKDEKIGLSRRLRYLSTKNIAELLELEGETAAALDTYARASDLDSTDIRLWLHVGQLCESCGALRAARYAYERGLLIQADDHRCLRGLARLAGQLGDILTCLATLQHLLARDPGDRLLLRKLREVRLVLNQPGQIGRLVGNMAGLEQSEETCTSVDKGEPFVLQVQLNTQNGERTHAWVRLGKVFLEAQGALLGRPVAVEMVSEEDRATGGRRSRMSRPARITEAERRCIGQDAERIEGAEEEGSSGADSVSDKAARRVSQRQQERKEREGQGQEGQKTPEQLVREWLELKIGKPEDEEVWGEVRRNGRDEGAEMVKGRLRPFKGTHNGLCQVCGDGGDLLCCETCSGVYHPNCLIRPPAFSQALYCDACREEAFSKAHRARPGTYGDRVLYSSQVEEIVNDFLPTITVNLGLLDLMHRLLIRLGTSARPQNLRLTQAGTTRIWEDGTLRKIVLQLEMQSRAFAQDWHMHSCEEAAWLNFDFGIDGELFLAELHVDELVLSGFQYRGGASAMTRHVQACDVFVSKVLRALELKDTQPEDKPHNPDVAVSPETNAEEGLSLEYRCRTLWMRALLESWRGRSKLALILLRRCERLLELVGGSVELPHCQRYSAITPDNLSSKRRAISEARVREKVRDLTAAYRRGALANQGRISRDAARAFSLIFRGQYFLRKEGQGERTHIEELLQDFLHHEAADLMAVVSITSFCAHVDRQEAALKHQSTLILALVTFATLDDLTSTLHLLLTVLHHLVDVDPSGDRLIADFLRTTDFKTSTKRRDGHCLNIRLLESICQYLTMSFREGLESIISLSDKRTATLADDLGCLVTLSAVSFSRLMLDTCVITLHHLEGLEQLASLHKACRQTMLRSLGAVLCSSQLSPDNLLYYVKSQDGYLYCIRSLEVLAGLLQHDTQPDPAAIFTSAQIPALVAAVAKLSHMAWCNWATQGSIFFPSYWVLANLICKADADSLQLLCLMHDALGFAGVCGAQDGCFLRMLLRMSSERPENEQAHRATLQGIRCLYDVELQPCEDHHAAAQKPRGLHACLSLAVVILRHLDAVDEILHWRRLLNALQTVVQQEPLLRTPLVHVSAFDAIDAYLFRGASDLAVSALERVEDEELLHKQLALALQQVPEVHINRGSEVHEDLLLAYKRLYDVIVELAPVSRSVPKKGQGGDEVYQEYERSHVEVLQVCINNLKFHPASLPAWVGLMQRLWKLYLTYLDQCPGLEADQPIVGILEQAIEDHADSLPSIERFLIPYFGYAEPWQALFAILQDVFEGDSVITNALGEMSDEMHERTWASIVAAIYRVLLSRAWEITDALLQNSLSVEDKEDKELAQTRVDFTVIMALVSYMRRYDLSKDDDRHEDLLEHAKGYLKKAQGMENELRKRWDIPLLLGKVLEKQGLLRFSDRSYAEMNRRQPGFVDSFMQLYNDAYNLAGDKNARKDAFYRLHASRLRVLCSGLKTSDSGHASPTQSSALPENLLRQLWRYNSPERRAPLPVPTDWATLREEMIQDGLDVMSACRKQWSTDHRSIYRRAVTIEQLPMLRSHGPGRGRLDVLGARDQMRALFDKRRPQIVAMWLPEETQSAFDISNQRPRKYEQTRCRYVSYYLSLLKRCADWRRLQDLNRSIRTLRDQSPETGVLHQAVLQTLIEVIEQMVSNDTIVRQAPDILLDTSYDISEQLRHDPAGHRIALCVVKIYSVVRNLPAAEQDFSRQSVVLEEARAYCKARLAEKHSRCREERAKAQDKPNKRQRKRVTEETIVANIRERKDERKRRRRETVANEEKDEARERRRRASVAEENIDGPSDEENDEDDEEDIIEISDSEGSENGE